MPPRVLFASYHGYHDPASGAAVCTRDLFAALAARGWRVGAFTGPYLDNPTASPVNELLRGRSGITSAPGSAGAIRFTLFTTHEPGGFPVTVFAPDPPVAARPPSAAEAETFLGVLDQIVTRFRPDVVLTYGGDPASAGVIRRARAAGAKVVFWLHNLAYRSADLFASCAAVVVPSLFSRDHYRTALGLNGTVLPGPFDPDRVVCPRSDESCVTYVNPEPAKGMFWFARLAAVLGRSRPDIRLLVVEGRGRADGLARCGVDLSGVTSLRRMANTPDPRSFYRLSRLVVLPSLVAEGFPRVAVEAQMNGIPVLGSGRGGLAEALRPGGLELPIPGHYTPTTRLPPTEAEVRPWVDAILRLWDDPAAYATAATAARAAAARWHPNVVVPRWEAFLTGLAGRG